MGLRRLRLVGEIDRFYLVDFFGDRLPLGDYCDFLPLVGSFSIYIRRDCDELHLAGLFFFVTLYFMWDYGDEFTSWDYLTLFPPSVTNCNIFVG